MQTDHNGIVFYEPNDSPSPFHTLLNAGQTSVSQAFDALEERFSEGAILLDEIDLPTNSRTGILTVPVELRNQFRQYRVEVSASSTSVTGSGNWRPTSIRINGDGGDNYRANATIFRGATVNQSELDDTGYPRTLYLGSFRGAASVDFYLRRAGTTNYVSWSGRGWYNSGTSANDNNGNFISGGRWNVSELQTISTFVIFTNATGAFYGSSSYAALWGYR